MGRYTFITLLLSALTVAAIAVGVYDWLHPGYFIALPVRSAAGTVAVILVAWLASRSVDRIADGLSEGRYHWQRRVRGMLGVETQERFREADLFAALLHVLIWLALPLLVLQLWGLSRASFDLLRSLAWTGFNIGQVRIVPAQLLMGAMVLVVIATLIRWLTRRLENQWLARTPMEAHTREAVATITGYVLFVVAALVILGMVGLDLTKLAFIAGALSVGIGFGLQTIVNNFVSGLILLFEQPIRRGNYITVGDTEGFVRRIRIRATEIETLQRTTIVVPNSELITLHVKNWNLRDRYGRISTTVGVAHGSDVRRVERLLVAAACAHADVLSDGQAGVPEPVALFHSIDGSRLEFELRCFVRDVTRRFFVISDLNFAIDAAFREHGVAVALPQLDVWHRTPLAQPSPPTDDLSAS